MSGLQEYHEVWLQFHPRRSVEWLQERMKDGFHIHHIDGDHSNNRIENLVLIEGADHMAIHSGMKTRIGLKPRAPKKRVLATVTDAVVHKSLKLQGIRRGRGKQCRCRLSCCELDGVMVMFYSDSVQIKRNASVIVNSREWIKVFLEMGPQGRRLAYEVKNLRFPR